MKKTKQKTCKSKTCKEKFIPVVPWQDYHQPQCGNRERVRRCNSKARTATKKKGR